MPAEQSRLSQSRDWTSPAGDALFNFVSAVLLTVSLLCCVLPFLWMIGNSFKTTEEIFLRPISLPNTVDLSVFSTAWVQARFSRALMNSVVSTVATVLMVLLFAALAAFPLARMNFTGSTIILRFFVVSIIVSAPVIVIPLFYMLINQKLYNTLGSIIVTNATMGIPLAVYLFWGFFKDIPLEIEESTQIDGCARWTFFWSFVVPLSRPVIATVAIFQSLWTWNEYIFSLTFLKSEAVRTIPLQLSVFFSKFSAEWSSLFAILSIAIVPMIVLFVVMQRSFIGGLTAGAVKL